MYKVKLAICLRMVGPRVNDKYEAMVMVKRIRRNGA